MVVAVGVVVEVVSTPLVVVVEGSVLVVVLLVAVEVLLVAVVVLPPPTLLVAVLLVAVVEGTRLSIVARVHVPEPGAAAVAVAARWSEATGRRWTSYWGCWPWCGL